MSIRNIVVCLALAVVPAFVACNKPHHKSSTVVSRGSDTRYEPSERTNSSVPAPSFESVGLPTPVSSDWILLKRAYYSMAFSRQHNEAAWVMWKLTPAMLAKGPREPFVADTDLPDECRVEKYDYNGSGYSRGHMMPAADCKFASMPSVECAFMSNICPQTEKLNSGSWNAVEMRCREWAKVEDSLYIVCGPIYNEPSPRQIGDAHKLDVPDAFFKVVLSLKPGNEKAIGFMMDNSSTPASMRQSVCSVSDVEQRTGLTFFPNLDANLSARVKAMANLRDWRLPKNLKQRPSGSSHRQNNFYESAPDDYQPQPRHHHRYR